MNPIMSGGSFNSGNEETYTLSDSARLSFRQEYRIISGNESGDNKGDDKERCTGSEPPTKRRKQRNWTLTESFDLRSADDLVVFRIKSTLEPSSTDARFVDLIVTVQDDSVVDNRVFLFQSLEYSISWKNIRRVAEYVFTEDNHRIVPYSSVSRRYVKFCLLDDLRSANNVTKDDTDSFELIDALVKVNLHFKSQSKVIHSSSPDDLSEGFQTEFPTINICGNDSDHDNDSAEDDDDDNDSVEDDDDDNDSVEDDDDDNDSAADDEDSFDDSCSYTMCAETMDYYLYFLNPSGPCHSNLTDLRQNVQVNCELAEFSKSCKMEDLFQICIMNLRRILQPSSPFPATLQIWNIASKYSLGELEIQAVETMERFIFSVPHSEKEAIQLVIKNFMRQHNLKMCSLTALLDPLD